MIQKSSEGEVESGGPFFHCEVPKGLYLLVKIRIGEKRRKPIATRYRGLAVHYLSGAAQIPVTVTRQKAGFHSDLRSVALWLSARFCKSSRVPTGRRVRPGDPYPRERKERTGRLALLTGKAKQQENEGFSIVPKWVANKVGMTSGKNPFEEMDEVLGGAGDDVEGALDEYAGIKMA